jgi:hypothetical protein
MNEIKTQIICDTNIWYDLGNNCLSFPDNTKYHLIATYINLFELTNSPNIIADFEKVRKALKAIKLYASGLIYEPPLKHLKNLLYPNKLEYSDESKPQILIDTLIDIEKIDDDIIHVIYESNLGRRSTLQTSFIDDVSDQLQIAKEVIHNDSTSKRKFLQLLKEKEIRDKRIINVKEQVIKELKDCYPFILDEDFNDSFWKNIELFTQARIQYFYNLKINPKMKPKINDAADMLNLVYVNEGRLYWTSDGLWHNLIRETKLEKLLYR